ncbi:AAA family ATPase [Lacihabitans soyangensis]|uniref:Chromosome segregation protein SMC n=1 Tax=Lacihabitans soyangensis TaxID=869394 RepID=A0AAE3KTC9_9BACT|nr:AAA family ATPase [Lacihabitans soyangensis]MCP9763599.1 chromosome segregation protein SMC [Lacihabitans soyangensis]
MKIKSLNIKNFKSIVDITINEPNPFTVFVGPNGSGKSNIFECLQFMSLARQIDSADLFGGFKQILNRKSPNLPIDYEFNFLDDSKKLCNRKYSRLPSNQMSDLRNYDSEPQVKVDEVTGKYSITEPKDFYRFNRIFIKNKDVVKINYNSNNFLIEDCSNLEKVLKRLLEEEFKREEITDWLSLFIPEFDKIEVQKPGHSSKEDLFIYQKYYDEPFDRELISDGTYNIIALLTAVYQSDEPQFLCIEEPENGLHPFVIRKLVDFFRQACEDKGHYIWLNTHSQTLVECLTADEVIVVDKSEGETKVTQLKGTNLHGLDMAEYWLSGATGGGTPW